MSQYLNSLIASIKNNHVLVQWSFHNVFLGDEDLKHYPLNQPSCLWEKTLPKRFFSTSPWLKGENGGGGEKTETSLVERPEWEAVMLREDYRAWQEKERLLFLGRKAASLMLWTLCLLKLSQPPFLPIKAFSFPCHVVIWIWLTMIADPKLQFSAGSE